LWALAQLLFTYFFAYLFAYSSQCDVQVSFPGAVCAQTKEYLIIQMHDWPLSIGISDIINSQPQDGTTTSLRQATTLELSWTNQRSFDNNY